MLSEIHFLLTYQCNFECDHCFLYCSPYSEGTFTIQAVEEVLNEALKLGTIDTIFFEGGEPTLYYPLLVESIRRASQKGFQVGIVTNAYGALSGEDADIWLKPLVEAGLSVLSVSDDEFHYGDMPQTPPSFARMAAERLQLENFPICIDAPQVIETAHDDDKKGKSLIDGGAKFRGRAADKLSKGLPTRPWMKLTECPYEDLLAPSRVHVDPFGNIHICQGISIGNFFVQPLSEIMKNYHPEKHPICGPLHQGGPAGLIEALNLEIEDNYVDECHCCFEIRRQLLNQYSRILTPPSVYGLD
jgi:MoaA/NifB/PqqE/SkfB family radical SAM enzyme